MNMNMVGTGTKLSLFVMSCLALASCEPTSGRGPTAIAIAPPPPKPPTPKPIDYNTVEYRKNYGLSQMKAIVAYNNGATGQGITVAVIDSGIDTDHPQIMANIHADSTNIATGKKADLNDVSGHGTGVAGVIATLRDPANNSSVNAHGVAFDAKIMALNAATVGTCEDANGDGCTFSDRNIAAALDYARTRGVKIVNISLGGNDYTSFTLIQAYKRAVQAGMVIIIAAGNRDKDGSDTDVSMARPENSAAVAWKSWANGQIIVAGAVGQSAGIATFSHRAGNVAKNVYLVAAGERVPSLGKDGLYFFWSGTSFSAPHISGAAALLMQAFPNLSGKQVADLLFSTATDLGDVGNDVIYGRGLVNIEEAFKPQGTRSIAVKTASGATAVVDLDRSALLGGAAFGGFSGLASAVGQSMMLDSYNRSYRVNLGQRVFAQGKNIHLESLIGSQRGSRASSLQLDPSVHLNLSWSENERFQDVEARYFSHQNTAKNRTHDLRMKLNFSLTTKQKMTFAQGLSLKEVMEDYDQDEFLTIGREDFMALMGRKGTQSALFAQRLTRKTRLDMVMSHSKTAWQDYGVTANSYLMMARLDHGLSPAFNLGLDLGVMAEKGRVLGSLSSGAIALGKGATTTFIAARFNWRLARGLNFFTKAAYGRTAVSAADISLVEGIDQLASGSFSIGVTGNSLLQKGDRLSFAVSQPLRIMGGHADISYVRSRNFETNNLSFVSNQISLTPRGREIDFELAYHVANLLGGGMNINFLHQINPNHNPENPDNAGVLIRFGSKF